MELILELDKSSPEPLYVQIANALRKEIEEGVLKQGQPLPSCQELADSLSASRLTVRRSYELLSSQGYIKTFSRGKTFVSKTSPQLERNLVPPSRHENPATNISAFGERLLLLPEESPELEFETYCGAPRLEELPINRWRDCLNAAVRIVGSELLMYENDSFGLHSLREAIRQLVMRSRSIRCSTEQIVVYSSTEGGFDLLCRILLDERGSVVIEDPGFPGAQSSFRMNNVQIETVRVDSEGLDVEQLDTLNTKPKLIYATPSRQDPTGVAMSTSRKMRLLAWAKENEAWIVEDDFDSEFRYGEDASSSLQSIDRDGVVIYRYNFWKTLFPLLRLSFTILPASLVPVFRKAQNVLQRDVPLVEQAALATFIEKGHFEKHVRSCQKLYARRRAALFLSLTKEFGSDISISRTNGGTNLLVTFSQQYNEIKIVQAASQTGLPLRSTSTMYFNVKQPVNEFLLSFVGLRDDQIDERVANFKQLCQ